MTGTGEEALALPESMAAHRVRHRARDVVLGDVAFTAR